MPSNTKISRVKTFTIQKREEKSCALKKGLLIYHSTDEKGDSRKIAAIVSYGFRGKIKSIKPVYEREALILHMFKDMDDGESVTINFETNTARKAISSNERHIYQDAYDEAVLMSSINNFSTTISFYLKIFIFFTVSFLVVYAFMNIGPMINELQRSH